MTPERSGAHLADEIPLPAHNGPVRRICLCADDYGISPAVNAAIRELLAAGRINATSVMVVAPAFDTSEARALTEIAASRRIQTGLHLTLTAPFRPLSEPSGLTVQDRFPRLPLVIMAAAARAVSRRALATEIAAQLEAFVAAFGRPPDFVDGHQHVQLLPRIREAVLTEVKRAAPAAWVRQCGSLLPPARRLGDPKGLFIDWLSGGFRRRARTAGIATNPAFAGTYGFTANADFAALFPRFLDGLPDGGVVMCHPGHVDAQLRRLDPVTHLREREYAYFLGPAYPRVLAAHGVELA